MSKGSAPDPIPESQYSKTMADIARKQQDWYKQNYQPQEQALIERLQRNPLADLGKAQTAFDASALMNDGIRSRSLSRFGTVDRNAGNSSRLAALSNVAATGAGITSFGANSLNTNNALLGDVVGLGRQAVGQAQEGLGTANSNYMAQQQQYQQAQAAQNNANAQATGQLVQGAGLAAMLAFSDSELKEAVTEIDSALDKLDALTGVTWQWNDEANELGLVGAGAGVIAQDVQAVLPQAIKERDEHLAVDYAAVIGLLVNAVKELKQEVATLRGDK
jgi:hypothetical protein